MSEELPVLHHPCGTREVRHPWHKAHSCPLCDAIFDTKTKMEACFDPTRRIVATLRPTPCDPTADDRG